MARILIVDDNAEIRAALCQMLEAAGYSTIQAPNGTTAMSIHRAGPLDLIITDIFMPDMDGLELIYQFRRESPEVAIVAISGGGTRGMTELLIVAKKMGARATFMKPFDWAELLSTVEEILEGEGEDAD